MLKNDLTRNHDFQFLDKILNSVVAAAAAAAAATPATPADAQVIVSVLVCGPGSN